MRTVTVIGTFALSVGLAGTAVTQTPIVGTMFGLTFYVDANISPAEWQLNTDYPPGSIVLGEGDYYFARASTIGDPPPTSPWLKIFANTAWRPDADIIGTVAGT